MGDMDPEPGLGRPKEALLPLLLALVPAAEPGPGPVLETVAVVGAQALLTLATKSWLAGCSDHLLA